MVKKKGLPSRSSRIRKKIETHKELAVGYKIRAPRKLAYELLEKMHLYFGRGITQGETPYFVEEIMNDAPFEGPDYRIRKQVVTLVKGRILSKGRIDVNALKEITEEIGKETIKKSFQMDFEKDAEGGVVREAKRIHADFLTLLNHKQFEKELDNLIQKHKY